MRIVLGTVPGVSARGAMAFARWLLHGGSVWACGARSNTRVPALEVVAVHVLEEHEHAYSPTLVDQVRPKVEESLADAGLDAGVESVHLPFGVAEVQLRREALERDAGMLLVGRRSAGGSSVGRASLGRVLRRLVARSETPLVSVPPDVRVGDLGAGPVLVVQEEGHEGASVGFGRRLARVLERPVRVLRVFPALEHGPDLAHGDDATDRLTRENLVLGREHQRWLARHDLDTGAVSISCGDVRTHALQWASQCRAPVVVCGVEPGGIVERVLHPPIGPRLMAASGGPVALVSEGVGPPS